MAIFTIVVSGISLLGATQRESLVRSVKRQQASELAQQQLERVQAAASSDWQAVPDGTWHIELVNNTWVLVSNPVEDEGFNKSIVVESINRDAGGMIVSTGGWPDPSTKKITSRILWEDNGLQQLSIPIVLTNYWGHNVWIEDTYDDFADGIEDATDFSINPGYVQLAQTGGGGDWTEPSIIGSVDALGKANGIWAENGYIFLALGSSKMQIEVFDIATDPASPVSLGSFAVSDNVNNVAVYNDYLYASVDSVQNGLDVFNIAIDPVHPTFIGTSATVNKPSGLWVQNDYLYVSVDGAKKVDVYSLSNPESPAYTGSFSTSANTIDISGSGNYLYIAQASNANAIEVFDLSSSPTTPVSLGSISSFYNITGIWLEGNTLYTSLAQKRAAMYTLTANPTRPLLLGIFSTTRNTSDITALGDYGYVAGEDSQLKAIEVIYIGDSKGLSGIYFVYGEYTSSVLDTNSVVSSYRLNWEGNETVGTQILFQTAVSEDNIVWDFVGPDGTAGSYFEEPGPVSFPYSAGRYFRYKAILLGDGSQTPVLDKVTVSYVK